MIEHPNASADARALREELHRAEVELRDQRERVAELRRRLPRDTPSDDLVFEELRDGRIMPLRLSELFADPAKPLVLMHFMFGKAQTQPCPMCTMWADGYAGVVSHLSQRLNFAVIVAGELERFDAFSRERGWNHLRIISAADTSLKRDLGFENEEGGQMPGVSVFERSSDGKLTHFYSVCAFGPDGGRMMDLLSPVWNFFDLTPDGRGEFNPSRNY
jgi:predicted dithiol-disulfide oxidoreductase (DUF899 family)